MAVKITKDMTINDVMELDRRTAPILLEYGMHCLGCPMSMMETLEQATSAHGVSVDELVDKLNEFFEENTI